MSTYDISKHERSISIFEHFMTKFHELPEQPSYVLKNWAVGVRVETQKERSKSGEGPAVVMQDVIEFWTC